MKSEKRQTISGKKKDRLVVLTRLEYYLSSLSRLDMFSSFCAPFSLKKEYYGNRFRLLTKIDIRHQLVD
jgi:hypothetical protein